MEANTQRPQPMTAEPQPQHEWVYDGELDDDGQWQEVMRARYRRV